MERSRGTQKQAEEVDEGRKKRREIKHERKKMEHQETKK